jgi:hypothetical protein
VDQSSRERILLALKILTSHYDPNAENHATQEEESSTRTINSNWGNLPFWGLSELSSPVASAWITLAWRRD